MYGQGNYASGPPFQQRPSPLPFQQGPPSLRPLNYQHGPPPPPPIPATGLSSGQQYVNPSLQGQGRQHYSADQHHSQWAQNMFQGLPEIPTSVPGNTVQPSSVGQGPPRGPFCSVGGAVRQDPSLPPYDSYRYPMSQHPQFPSMVSPPPLPASLAQSPPHPVSLPPGTSSSPAYVVQFSADDLGQSCSYDSRKNEKESDPVDRVITLNESVDNPPARGNSLEKGGSGGSSLQHHNLTDAVMSFSPSISDMDMEDDITHPAEDKSICLSNFNHGSSSEPVTDSQTVVEQDRVSMGSDVSRDPESGSRNSFQIFDSSILLKQSEPPVNSMTHQSSCPHEVSVDSAGKNLEKPVNDTTKLSSPLNLLGDYSSDDSAENSVALVRAAKPEVAPSVPRDRAASFCTDIDNNSSDDHEPKILLNSEKGFDPLVESSRVSSGLLKSNVKSESDIPVADAGSSAAGDFEDPTDHKKGSQKAFKVGSPLEVIRHDAKTGISQEEELKGTSGKSKVDEFYRLVREDHSDNGSDESPRFTRRRSKRGRSRSWSRSPIRGRSRSRSRSPRGRRRKSPCRRRGRHGRSRSSSPKRRRSRSKSPSYRHGGDIGNEKTRRHKAQLPECLDYIRGKCHRGASCRYMHHQSVKTTDRLRSSHMKQQGSNIHGDMNHISPRSAYEHKEHDESQNSKQETFFTGESGGVIEELPFTEIPVGVPPDISNCQTQFMDGQVAAETSLQSSTPLAPESIMPQSFLPELSPSVGNHSSNSLGGNRTVSTNQISRDHNLILQHSQFPPPSTTSWNPLPPPPPLPIPFHNNSIGNTASGLPLAQFQQNMQPPGTFQASMGVGQPGVYPKRPEPHKYTYDSNRFGPMIMPVMSKPMDQIHGPSSHMHPYMHHSHYGPLPAPEGVPVHYCEPVKVISTLSNCSSDNPEMSQPQHFTELGGSRFSNHFPPLAPILTEPLISKFSSNIVTQGKDIPSRDIYGTPYGLNHASADGLPATRSLPAPAADQYDPLYDSVEPSSSSAKKLDFSHKLPSGDSDVVLRTSGPNQLLDVDGNNKQKGIGGAEGFLSPENDAYGETADAEVGDVEDGSASNPQSAADMATEEDEINQVKASGKTKKGKDSKSMKFFKIAIADFVKEVLKPSWRQGNMSKEAFKTIVKKTVDKVSVATGKHHLPKSREKIDRYIDSQQRKLTKLVMGYVEKYVKA